MKIVVAVLLLVAAIACSDDAEEGIEVQVAVAGQELPTTLGTVELAPSFVVIQATELIACETVAQRIWRAVNPLPSAFAHGESSPVKLATPVVVPLTGTHTSLVVGNIEPPPDSYCSVELELGVADDDAVGLPAETDMVGKSLYVAGAVADTPFEAVLAANDHVQLTITELTLDSDHRSANLVVSIDTTGLFTGIDFASSTLASDIAINVRGVFRVETQ